MVNNCPNVAVRSRSGDYTPDYAVRARSRVGLVADEAVVQCRRCCATGTVSVDSIGRILSAGLALRHAQGQVVRDPAGRVLHAICGGTIVALGLGRR